MLKVFYVGVNGLTADAVLHTLSDYRLERLKKTARSEAKAQSLAAELLLIHAVRTVYPEVPPRVEYQLTELGKSFLTPMKVLVHWAAANHAAICDARAVYEKRAVTATQGALPL